MNQLAFYLLWSAKHFFLLGLMLAAAGSLGWWQVRRLPALTAWEKAALGLALGFGSFSFGLFGLGILGGLYRPLIWGMTIGLALHGLWIAARKMRRARLSSWPMAVILAAGLAYASLLFVSAQFPPSQWDAIGYHLPFARESLAGHRIAPVQGISTPIMPALNHMLFVWALALGDDILAQMVECTLLLLSGLVLFAWGERQGRPVGGLLIALLWLAQPLVKWIGTAAYIDVGLTCFAWLGIYLLNLHRLERDERLLRNGLLLLAMAAACKVSGLFFLGLGGLYGLWAIGRGRMPVKSAAAVLWPAVAMAIPWYALIWHHTGNPVWPMFMQWSRPGWRGGEGSWENFQVFFGGSGVEKTPVNFLRLPELLLRQQPRFFMDGGLGYWPIMALYPAMWGAAIWKKSVRWWMGWFTLYLVFWFWTASYLRYLMPVIPVLIVGLYECVASGVESLWRRRWLRWAMAGLIIAGAAFWRPNLPSMAGKLSLAKLPPATSEDRVRWLARVDGYDAASFIAREAEPDDRVYLFGGNYIGYYVERPLAGWYARIDEDEAGRMRWPGGPQWRGELERHRPRWLLVIHRGLQPPAEGPFPGQEGMDYRLVFSSGMSFVFRRD